jgi:PAS domain S-box-containing protein
MESRILDGLAIGVFTVDPDYRITFFNVEAARLTGFTRAEALGKYCYEIFRSNICMDGCAIKSALSSGHTVYKKRATILSRKNQEIPIELTAAVLRDDAGEMIGAVESFADDRVRSCLEKNIKKTYSFGDIIGRSVPMRRIYDILPALAQADVNVLVLGETGTGKDLVARAIHNKSRRSKNPFIKVNCPALPESLLESELFGYKRGAFTDAKCDKPGLFETAGGGTLFLDEIGDLPLLLQSKLLQVLEEREFRPLGATKSVRVDVRLIASTNQDLEAMIARGEFRKDLFFRLQVGGVHLPPLRERMEDLPLLLDHFSLQIEAAIGRAVPTADAEVLRLLMLHEYPGNVRELRHIIEHAALLASDGVIRVKDLPHYLLANQAPAQANPIPKGDFPLPESQDQAQRRLFLEVLTKTRWNKTQAAKLLGIGRTTLWRRIVQLGLDIDQSL